ncbi:hypothetical protein F8163_22720 [Bacillus luti]|uniref:Uncharacterized protein n=1 Tax=Bacillus luti TaxID=2026191 RepID=A0A7V7S5K7_9BACI|nr:hypothetical protein F8163_22720 [Bacillus luti]
MNKLNTITAYIDNYANKLSVWAAYCNFLFSLFFFKNALDFHRKLWCDETFDFEIFQILSWMVMNRYLIIKRQEHFVHIKYVLTFDFITNLLCLNLCGLKRMCLSSCFRKGEYDRK